MLFFTNHLHMSAGKADGNGLVACLRVDVDNDMRVRWHTCVVALSKFPALENAFGKVRGFCRKLFSLGMTTWRD